MRLREPSALLWQKILRTNPSRLFSGHGSRLLRRHAFDCLPQPGYVGSRYRAGGLLFVSMNPGAGSQGGRNPDDLRQYSALQTLRDADGASICAAFDEAMAVLADIMPRWKIYRNFVEPLLGGSGMDFSEVAYINLLKWRTSSSDGLSPLYQLSWKDHTGAQFDLLAPRRVVAIGSDAGRWFELNQPRRSEYFDFIPRVIGNNIGKDGHAAMRRIVDRFSINRGERS
jgi:hypothetical protein